MLALFFFFLASWSADFSNISKRRTAFHQTRRQLPHNPTESGPGRFYPHLSAQKKNKKAKIEIDLGFPWKRPQRKGGGEEKEAEGEGQEEEEEGEGGGGGRGGQRRGGGLPAGVEVTVAYTTDMQDFLVPEGPLRKPMEQTQKSSLAAATNCLEWRLADGGWWVAGVRGAV